MANALLWRDLSNEQISSLVDGCSTSASIRKTLQTFMKLEESTDSRPEVLLDLYVNAFLFTQDHRFTAEKTSAFISIAKDIHTQAVGERLTLERSWERTKNLLLTHSVQRPPFSVQIFSWGDLKAITSYLLNTYYRHYKLYQYSFCPTYILDLETYEDDIEISPFMPSLNEALSQEQWDAEQEALRKQREAEEAQKMADQALAEEAARQASIEAAYREAVPEEVSKKTKALVDYYLEKMKSELMSLLQEQEKKLDHKFSTLQASMKSK